MEWMIGFAMLLAVMCAIAIVFNEFQSKRNWWALAGMLVALVLLVSGLEGLKEIEAKASAIGGGDKTLQPNDANIEHAKFIKQVLGVEIPVPEFPVDYKAQDSDLGKLSKSLLGELYTYIQSIEYKSKEQAVVKARVANLSCEMEFKTMTFAGDQEPSWKLDKLNCS